MKKIIIYAGLVSIICLQACEDKRTESGDMFGQPGPLAASTLTPTQQQQKLEDIGQRFLASFDAADQKPLAESLLALASYAGIAPQTPEPASALDYSNLLGILQSASEGDLTPLVRAASSPAQIVSITSMLRQLQLTSTYDPASQDWRKTPSNERKATFIWDNSVLTATWSSKEQSWQGNAGGPESVKIVVPAEFIVSLNIDGRRHLGITLRPGLSDKAFSPRIEVSVNGGLAVAIGAKAGGESVEVTGVMTKNDKVIATVAARMMINGIMDSDNWFREVEYTWTDSEGNAHTEKKPKCVLPEYVLDNARTGQVAVNILSASVYGQGDLKTIVSSIEDAQNTPMEDELQAKMLAALINTNATAYLYYNDDRTKAADFYLHAYQNDASEWSVEPVMVFGGDGARISVAEFFSPSAFGSLIGAAQQLLQSYMELFAPMQ